MKLSDSRVNHRKLRAPQEPNSALIEPSPYLIGGIIANNRRAMAQGEGSDIGGLSLGRLSTEARTRLYRSALRHTGQYRSLSAYHEDTPQTMILSGHQLELFHPGVWFKNVALSQWSREHKAVGIHLLIDSDLCRAASIRVPTGTLAAPATVDVPFDLQRAIVSFEERAIQDVSRFDSFERRVKAAIERLVPNPLVVKMWRFAREAARSGCGLGQAISQARHLLEQTWGLETLEVPWSKVCDTDSFRRFSLAILLRLPDFQTVHNRVLREYRKFHKIRGRARPVAELTSTNADGWMETPFWCWSTSAPQRRPLLARFRGGGLVIRPEGTSQTIHLDGNMDRAIEQLAVARAQDFKIRSRALVTTMYARLVLSDLFLHGIGGAKYDELTDAITHRFWGISPPEYVVLSATIPLPISRSAAQKDDLRRIEQMLRDLWYHPENHVKSVAAHSIDRDQWLRLIAEKNRWIQLVASSQEPGISKLRHNGLLSTTASLRDYVLELRTSLLEERTRLVREVRHSAVLSSREYSFCLFPESQLRQTLLDLLR